MFWRWKLRVKEDKKVNHSKIQWPTSHSLGRLFKEKKKEKTENSRCWWRYGDMGTLVHCSWEGTIVQLLWKTVSWFLKKLKIELPYDPSVPVLGKDTKKWNRDSHRYLYMYIHNSVIHCSQKWKQSKCLLTGGWISEVWYAHLQTHTHTHAHTHDIIQPLKDEILTHATTWISLFKNIFWVINLAVLGLCCVTRVFCCSAWAL